MDPNMVLFLCGDVMLGRGIDQVMPAPGNPDLYESWIRNAGDYVRLAERAHGPIPRPVGPGYVWGDALEELSRRGSQVRLINLETSLTARGYPWPDKGIHYRMNPPNADCLTAAGIGACVLGNNHVLDWGEPGLLDTLETLDRLGIAHAGAGRTLGEARAPAVLASGDAAARVLVFGLGSESSGVPEEWAAGAERPGLYVAETRRHLLRELGSRLCRLKREGDIAIASVHLGGNWGYAVPAWQVELARGLIEAGFDMVHGHSSHHPKGIESYMGKPILYGCGDFLNDYEGIHGYEEYRPDLGLMYFPEWDPASKRFIRMRMSPMRTRRFQATKASREESDWMGILMRRLCAALGTYVRGEPDGTLRIDFA
jgi:poly-gamma-glutamate synthesis protein (capsule biosynthesis protein)